LAHVLPGKSGIEQVTSGKQTGLLNVPPDKTGSEQTGLEKFGYNKIFTWSGPTANQVKIFVATIEKLVCHKFGRQMVCHKRTSGRKRI
jgi:hypothetical protein